MSTASPVSAREIIAWALLALSLCGAGYLFWENDSLKRSIAEQATRNALNSALSIVPGNILAGGRAAPTQGADGETPVNGAALRIESVLDNGVHLKFDDGSFWEVETGGSMPSKWTKGQSVTLVKAKNSYNLPCWRLMNEEASNSVNAQPLLTVKPGTKPPSREDKIDKAEKP